MRQAKEKIQFETMPDNPVENIIEFLTGHDYGRLARTSKTMNKHVSNFGKAIINHGGIDIFLSFELFRLLIKNGGLSLRDDGKYLLPSSNEFIMRKIYIAALEDDRLAFLILKNKELYNVIKDIDGMHEKRRDLRPVGSRRISDGILAGLTFFVVESFISIVFFISNIILSIPFLLFAPPIAFMFLYFAIKGILSTIFYLPYQIYLAAKGAYYHGFHLSRTVTDTCVAIGALFNPFRSPDDGIIYDPKYRLLGFTIEDRAKLYEERHPNITSSPQNHSFPNDSKGHISSRIGEERRPLLAEAKGREMIPNTTNSRERNAFQLNPQAARGLERFGLQSHSPVNPTLQHESDSLDVDEQPYHQIY